MPVPFIQKEEFKTQDKDQNTYATNFGEDLSFYTSSALDYATGGSLAKTNNHNNGQVTSEPSVFNDNTIKNNNANFAKVDTSKGDDLAFLVPIVIGSLIGGGTNTYSQYKRNEGNLNLQNLNKTELLLNTVTGGISGTAQTIKGAILLGGSMGV